MSDQSIVNDKELLHSLEEKKRALEEIMHVAQTVERLQEGLQAVLMMGEAANLIPRQVLDFYRGLDRKLRGQPVDKLAKLLSGLEQAIRNDLGQILQLAVVDDATMIDQRTRAEAEEESSADDISRLAEDFRRRVQTAVYLRVLLREQGSSTEPMELAVPTEQIQQQIDALDERGLRCRKNMQVQVGEMLKDIIRLLANDVLPDTMKEQMRQAQVELEQNLKHLEAGKSVEDMPFYVDSFLLQDDQPEAAELNKAAVREPSLPDATPGKKANIPQPENNRRGWLRCLWLWCMTPKQVGWEEIRSGQYKHSNGKK